MWKVGRVGWPPGRSCSAPATSARQCLRSAIATSTTSAKNARRRNVTLDRSSTPGQGAKTKSARPKWSTRKPRVPTHGNIVWKNPLSIVRMSSRRRRRWWRWRTATTSRRPTASQWRRSGRRRLSTRSAPRSLRRGARPSTSTSPNRLSLSSVRPSQRRFVASSRNGSAKLSRLRIAVDIKNESDLIQLQPLPVLDKYNHWQFIESFITPSAGSIYTAHCTGFKNLDLLHSLPVWV